MRESFDKKFKIINNVLFNMAKNVENVLEI
jgi:hypothetical protein